MQQRKKVGIRLRQLAKGFTLPGLQDVPVYYVISFYKRAIAKGVIGVRAAAISFNFFMALFPGIIFAFSLIPFIHIPHFQGELISLMKDVLPTTTFNAIENTVIDATTNRRGSLLSIGFFISSFFIANGTASTIASLNASANFLETRSWISTRLMGFFVGFILLLQIGLATSLIIFNRGIVNFLVTHEIIHNSLSHVLLLSGKWLIVIFICLSCISSIYYYAPAKRTKYYFFSPGSIMATLLIILTTGFFSYYIRNFANYNAIFGSIGTLIALMIWFNLNAFVLLIGFELNISIRNAKINHQKVLGFSKDIEDQDKFFHKEEELE